MFKNQFYFKSTKNLWPPFRLPKPVTQQDLTDQASNATEQTAEEKNESAFLTCSNGMLKFYINSKHQFNSILEKPLL